MFRGSWVVVVVWGVFAVSPSFSWLFEDERVLGWVLLEVERILGGASEAWLCGDPGPALAQVREALELLEGLEDQMVEGLKDKGGVVRRGAS